MLNNTISLRPFTLRNFYFLLLLSLFLTLDAKAQGNVWTFEPFNGVFPHAFAQCPQCSDVATLGSQPQTNISFAINGYTGTTPNRDLNLFATLTGGRLMGGNYDDQTCEFNTLGYGTIGYSDLFASNCANAADTIKATFSQPVLGTRIDLRGKYPQTLVVTESGRPPVSVALGPTFRNGQLVGGQGSVFLSRKKITGLSVKSTDPNYAFSVGNISVIKIAGSGSSGSGNPPPNYCNVTPQARPSPENISRFGWTMRSEISDNEGLVLTDVRLNGRLMAERISIPYYRIETNTTPPFRGELRPNDTGGSLRSRLISYDPVWDNDRLFVRATYAIDNVPSSTGCLTITQESEFTRPGLDAPCEPNDSISCQKYRSRVTYNYTGITTGAFSVSVAQRNHFTVNGAANNSVGLFRDCDSGIIDCLQNNYGVIFKNKINPLFTEYYLPVIVGGKDNKLWDNMHQTLQSSVTEPPANPLKWIWGGCPECLHTHWRWGANLGDHFGNGRLLLPFGTTQDLSIGIVRNRLGEERPYDFLDLLNSEPIRTRINAIDAMFADHYKYSVPEDVDYWLLAKGYKGSDEFFSYYSFFNPDSPNISKVIVPYQGFSKQSFLGKRNNIASASADKPTSIIYGHLYVDGVTNYSEIDPNTVSSLPAGYTAYNGIGYDIRTIAEASGPDTVTFNLPSVADQTTFDSLRVLHSEPDPYDSSQAIWVDRTILSPNTPVPDFANRNIFAKVNHVGPFIIAIYTPQPPNTNIADLSVLINDSVDPVTAGNQLTYTVNVTNSGPDAATEVILNNGLSPDVLFVSVNTPQGICREEDATIICKLGTIMSGATVLVTVVVEPNEGQTRFPTAGKTITNLAAVRANETDPDQSNNLDTENTNALPNPNAPPTSQIQSPAADAIFTGPANFTVVVGATDSDGTVAQVELFINGVSSGTGTFLETGKYSLNLSNLVYGEQSLIAVVTDNGGRKAISNSVHIFVNGPILITLDSPDEGSLFGSSVNIPLISTGTNASGTITQVQYFADGEPIGNGVLSGTNQYSLTWVAPSIGSHSLRAVATDGNGVKSWSETANIYVSNAPTVNVVSPTTGSSYPKNSDIAFTVNAKDFDGYVSSVELLVNGSSSLGQATLLQGSTFALTWYSVQVGTYSITAKATDNAGLVTISSPVNITLTNTPPTVSMTSPVGGAIFTSPANITLSANAADSDGTVSKVEFFKGTTLLGTILSPPYNFSWTNVAAGGYSLTAKATDDNNVATTSSPVAITVNPPPTALFVVGNTTLSSVDTAIKTRLQNLGLTVVVKSASASVTGDATGKRVVVISDSVTATSVNTKFRTVTIPVVTLSSQLFDDMGMCATATTNFGTTATQKNVTITNASHPMAAGLTGTVQVTTANTTFGWGKLNANAAKIATLTTDSTKATDFSYASGIVMPGLTALARRVGFFYTASSSTLTTNGGLLFDNAIKWAAGL